MNSKQPISSVEWVNRESLQPNDYNPNKQPPPEHKLLAVSILEDGWTQPIVVFDDGSGEKPLIVDGEHRWRVSSQAEVFKLTNGMVPIVRISGSRQHRMMSTIRHNRARGEHHVLPMAEIVKALMEGGIASESIQFLLQMEEEEVERLAERAGLPTVVTRNHAEFNKGWVPE
jgi:ParB-like chromosome segregation protein Spo0J